MKKMLMLISLCVFALGAFAQGIRFENDLSWAEIKAKAKKENKFIFLDCYATWCGPCKKMDKEIYPDAEVGNKVAEKFIAVKVQIDQVKDDSEFIKSWYADTKQIRERYKISEFPTFLFLNPDGELAYRDAGFKNRGEFLKLFATASDPVKNFSGLMKRFDAGELKGDEILDLAFLAKKLKYDSLALKIARNYKEEVLNKHDPSVLLTPKTLSLFGDFGKIFNAHDKLVRYIYDHQVQADSGFKRKGASVGIVDYYINGDVIFPKVFSPTMEPLVKIPSWNSMEKMVARSWDKETARRTILNCQIWYYDKKKDYATLVKYQIEQIETNGLAKQASDGFGRMGINNMVWHSIFEHSNDPAIIKKGLEYMAYLVNKEPTNSSWIDTYANLLYKSGDKDKGLEFERKALKLTVADKHTSKEDIDAFKVTLEKMEKNIPTWDK